MLSPKNFSESKWKRVKKHEIPKNTCLFLKSVVS